MRRHPELALEAGRAIRRPTLAVWYALACDDRKGGADALPADWRQQWLPAIRRFMTSDDATAPGQALRFDVGRSFIELRNRLAHGAGLNDGVSGRLLDIWEDRHAALVESVVPWLETLDLFGVDESGAAFALRGLVPAPLAAGASGAPAQAQPQQVWTRWGGHPLNLWPLLRFAAPIDEMGDAIPDKPSCVEVYVRTDASSLLQYNALGSDRLDWSFGAPASAATLNEWLPAGSTSTRVDVPGAVENFRRALLDDAAAFVGREVQVAQAAHVLRGLQDADTRVHWLHAEAGMGKSYFMAKLYAELEQDRPATTALIPYRFKLGDSRCSRLAFYQLVSVSLQRASGQGVHPAQDKSSLDLARQRCEAAGVHPVMLIDGLDEILQADPDFVEELAGTARASVKSSWLIASRPEPAIRVLLTASAGTGERHGDPGHGGTATAPPATELIRGGLGQMLEQDIRSMLLDSIGPKRSLLLESEGVADAEVALFEMEATPEMIEALDHSRLPAALASRLATMNPTAPPASVAWSARMIKPGSSWLLHDDNDDSVYFAEAQGPADRLSVRRDQRSHTPFVKAVCERSQGFPLYVRYIIGEIKSGRLKRLDDTEELPRDLQFFYRRMLSRSSISTLALVSPQLLCLMAAAREPLSAEQLAGRQHCPTWPILDAEDNQCNATEYVLQTVHSLATMLRTARSASGDSGFTVYHHSLREYLRSAVNIRDTYRAALRWFADIECKTLPISDCECFEGYVARHGVTHLLQPEPVEVNGDPLLHVLRTGRLASAVALVHHLSGLEQAGVDLTQRHGLWPGQVEGFVQQVFEVLVEMLRRYDDDSADGPQKRVIEDAARKLPARELAELAREVYETGTQVAPVRVLMQFNPDAWLAMRSAFIKPNDIVAKQAIAEAETDIYIRLPEGPQREARWTDLIHRSRGAVYEETEVANYALRFILSREPTHDGAEAVLSEWATSHRYVERMILGEHLVALAMQPDRQALVRQMLPMLQEADAFDSPWEYLRIDAREILAWAGSEADWALVPPSERALGLEARQLAEARIAETQRAIGPGVVAEAAAAVVAQFDRLSLGTSGDAVTRFTDLVCQHGGIRNLVLVRHVFQLLLAHPIWAVGERASTMMERLVRLDRGFQDLLVDVVVEQETGRLPLSHWRRLYGVVDAAFNISGLDDGELFQRVIRASHAHPVGRVRGICLDDVSAQIFEPLELNGARVDDAAQQACRTVFESYEYALQHWIRHASDCWELEYLHLIFAFLHERRVLDVAQWLRDAAPLSAYLPPRFFEIPRSEFLVKIDRAALKQGLARR